MSDSPNIAQQFFDAVGVPLVAVIASVLGAVGGLAFADKVTPRMAAIIVAMGVGFGSFGSQAAVAYLTLNPLVAGFIGFLGGILSMPILGLVFGVFARWRDKSSDIADRAVNRALPGGESGRREEEHHDEEHH